MKGEVASVWQVLNVLLKGKKGVTFLGRFCYLSLKILRPLNVEVKVPLR